MGLPMRCWLQLRTADLDAVYSPLNDGRAVYPGVWASLYNAAGKVGWGSLSCPILGWALLSSAVFAGGCAPLLFCTTDGQLGRNLCHDRTAMPSQWPCLRARITLCALQLAGSIFF